MKINTIKISLLLTFFASSSSYALQSSVINTASQTNIGSESSSALTPDDIRTLKKIVEQKKLEEYSGALGTAPKNQTVTSTGAAVEETQSGPQAFVFWTQTLSSGFYYDSRIYGKYNMETQNPAFPNIPPSSEKNPNGYKGVLKLGYNFHLEFGTFKLGLG